MNIYIEYVIIDNFIIDYLLLLTANKLLKTKVYYLRIIFASLLGVVFAFIFSLVRLNVNFLFVLKIISGGIIVLFSSKFKSFKYYIFHYLTFLLLTFLGGGVVIGVFSLFKIDNSNLMTLDYILQIPIGLVILALFILTRFCIYSFRILKRRQNVSKNIYDVEVRLGSISLKVKALYDTGNNLFSKLTLKPISIIDTNSFSKLLSMDFLMKKTKIYEEEIRTIDSVSKIKCVEVDCLKIYYEKEVHIIENVMLGIRQINSDIFEMILHSSVLDLD